MSFEKWVSPEGFTALAALFAASAALWQVKRLKVSIQVDTLARLIDRFERDDFEKKRKDAAAVCLANLEASTPTIEVEDVLDFFEDVAFFARTGALTLEMAWHGFYHWIRLYYQASENYIRERRTDEPTVYEELRWLYPKLNAIEKDKYPKTYRERLSNDELSRFLHEELE